MSRYILTVLLLLIVLLVGCTEDKLETANHNTSDNESVLDVSLSTEKNTYERGEDFNITLDIDYKGEPFKAAIIYDSYRESFTKHFYNGYIENISGQDINRSRFHAGHPGEKAFRIYENGYSDHERYFVDEGTYLISVYIYNCDEIMKEGYNCTPSHVFPSTFDAFDDTPENLLKNNVSYLDSAEKRITVEGGSVE